MGEMNVESFNLDHRKVKAPYVRIADIKQINDVTLTKYDIRFCQPNVEHLDMKTVHSIEHCFAEFSRDHSAHVIDFSPMGCQTGFYLLMSEKPNIDSTIDLISTTFHDIINATEVPAANPIQCGWGANHSLRAAQDAIQKMLNKKDEWKVIQ
ncbi:MAG: S-ribosylhomocysteine lyase [Actinomycetaceae bacterium]|nr:S-ribosylhomocysteine lyase [Actinomycetaceae bacterium]